MAYTNKFAFIFIFFAMFLSVENIAQTITLTYDASGNRLTKQYNNGRMPPTITADTVVCQRSIATFNAHGGATYLWDNGATDSVMSIIADTTIRYKVYSYTVNGCVDSNTKLLTVLPVPYTGPIAGVASSFVLGIETYSVTPHAGSIYHWTVTGGSIVPPTVFLSNTIYAQWVTPGVGYVSVYEEVDGNQCSTLPVDLPVMVIDTSSTSVNHLTGGETFKVYPNPSAGNVWVDYAQDHAGPIVLSLINSIGMVVYQAKYAANGSFHISMSEDLFKIPGIYTIQLSADQQSFLKKITVIK